MCCNTIQYFSLSFLHCIIILLLAFFSINGAQIHSIKSASIKARVFNNKCATTDMNLQHLQLENEVKQTFESSILPQLNDLYGPGFDRYFPATSCADINQGLPSGYYWLSIANESQLVYCSLNENRCCGGNDGKWMRIAYLNMSDPSTQCPDGWREEQSPIRTCRRQTNTTISSVNYTSYGIPYSRACGRIIAYQFGAPEAFLNYRSQNQATLEDAYVDGISVTFGHTRNHIWTFAAEKGMSDRHTCPCSGSTLATPPFINEDYFCECGTSDFYNLEFVLDNPLWDGLGCANASNCCQFNNPPWFCKQLNQPTTEDIEICIIGFTTGVNMLEEEDTPVEFIKIFVQ